MYVFYFYFGGKEHSCRTRRCLLYTGGINVTKLTIRNFTCHFVSTKWERYIMFIHSDSKAFLVLGELGGCCEFGIGGIVVIYQKGGCVRL